ncbi:MauE/DoxX family redox-associated membrane protein [Streptomyces profundus]|uniref:MauE/DoxX family redox-associated membrane protein n=1 Tax=Streptomyces profundus TaxID=2867410 RepID=UPI001D164900|nr:MauE/DoxX family redox-associated membrane protein [Streptomyces sp. MA3_2.13]UED87821.1 methylamine utilization protein MauE [Streptomyces sp. MA3_2.13]
MSTLIGAVATGVILLVLVAGCAAHLSRPTALPDALRAHRMLPARAVPLAARAVTLAEGLLGLGLAAALLGRHRLGLATALAASGALFVCYALYARHILATGRGGPCGCSRAEVPMSDWIVGRAWTFALLALGAAPLVAGPARPPDGAAETATAALAALTLAALLWVLPTAMAGPAAPSASSDRSDLSKGGHPAWTS